MLGYTYTGTENVWRAAGAEGVSGWVTEATGWSQGSDPQRKAQSQPRLTALWCQAGAGRVGAITS